MSSENQRTIEEIRAEFDYYFQPEQKILEEIEEIRRKYVASQKSESQKSSSQEEQK